jgi:hypothetical protein
MLIPVFSPACDDLLLEGGDIGGDPLDLFINLAAMSHRETGPRVVLELPKTLRESHLLTDVRSVAVSGSVMQWSLRSAIGSGVALSNYDFDMLRDGLVEIVHWARGSSKRMLGEWETEDGRRPAHWVPSLDNAPWDTGLLVRYGLVECRVAESYLRRRDDLEAAERDVIANSFDEAYMYAPNSGHWLNVRDSNFNLRALMTNAGFYADPMASVGSQSGEWAQLYLDSLQGASAWFDCSIAAPWFMQIEAEMQCSQANRPWIRHPTRDEVYAGIQGRRVLFLSPFASGIAELYASGRIRRLYSDVDFPEVDLWTLETPISTWPNRPGRCWSDTYHELVDAANTLVVTHGIDLVLGAAGSYGLPVLHAVHRQSGVACVYIGNVMNTYFGVLTGSARMNPDPCRVEANWYPSHLGTVPNVDRIDGGRYV